jgi:5-methylcytosine-specific restriction endonuclease McrA
MAVCCICNASTPTDAVLIDGSGFHRACHLQLVETGKTLSRTEQGLLAELRKPLTIGENVAMFLFEYRRQEILHRKQHLAWQVEQTREKMGSAAAALYKIYDVWPTYPPDWDKRRELVGDRDHYGCVECGVGNRLHLHHRRAINEGGTHHIDNLVLLCEFCHSEVHGGRKFREEKKRNDTETAIQRKIECIQIALTQRRDVHFRYKKRDGTITSRTVTPRQLRKLTQLELRALIGRNVPIEKEGRLCLFGHCHLRRANRTFAIDRISRISLC